MGSKWGKHRLHPFGRWPLMWECPREIPRCRGILSADGAFGAIPADGRGATRVETGKARNPPSALAISLPNLLRTR